MPDGVRLSADLYQPTGGQAGEKFPVLLEYLPYRKHEARKPQLAALLVLRGSAAMSSRAVDIRGTGNSEGRLVPYEYSDVEHAGRRDRDRLALEAALVERQRRHVRNLLGRLQFHTNVGAEYPRAQGDHRDRCDRYLYQDDVHYMDGIMHLDSWEMSMDLDNARPGAPEYRDR